MSVRVIGMGGEMRTRAFDWLDANTNTPMYGIQVLIKGEWMHLYRDKGVPAIFTEREKRDEYRKSFSRENRERNE